MEQVECTILSGGVHCTWNSKSVQYSQSPKLKKGYIIIKTSFETRVSLMGLGSFVDINIFVMKYYFI